MTPLPKALFLSIMLWPSGAVPGQETEKLGRLFYSPAQRAAMDRRQDGQSSGAQDEATDSITINGEIRHQGKRRTRWINGKESPEAQPATPPLAVGDRYRRSTGERESPLGDGRLSIKPGNTSR